MKILIMEGEDCIALKKLPQLIKTANKYELTEISLDALLLLRNEFAFMGRCTSLYNSEEEINRLKPFHSAILNCEDIYYDTIVLINKSLSSSEKILDEIPGRIRQIQNQAKIFRSKRLDILASRLQIAYFKLKNNFKGILKTCNYLEEKYISGKISDISVDLDYKEIIFLKLYCLYTLNKPVEANQYLTRKSGIFKQGSGDWFKYKEYQFLLYMKTQKYHQASRVYRNVKITKNFNKLPNYLKERWTIYRAYILFVNNTKLVRWGFDIEQFKSSTPSFPKKLMGYSINTLIIQFLFYLRDGDTKEVINKLDQLKPLSSQHLDKRHNYRNSIFIRMLGIIVERDYDYGSVSEKSRNYYHKLKETPLVPDFQLEMEVIPYEILWEYALNILKTNKYYVHYRFYNLLEA